MKLIMVLAMMAVASPTGAELWTAAGCSNTSSAYKALVSERPDLSGIIWARSAAGGGGSLDHWYDSIIGTSHRDFAGRYLTLQALYGVPTDLIFQACIRQSPIPPIPTAEQEFWHAEVLAWLRTVSPGVRVHFLPLAHYETDCRGGSEDWPVDLVGLALAEMHMEPGDTILPLLDPYTDENTRPDGCHPTPERSSYEAGEMAKAVQ